MLKRSQLDLDSIILSFTKGHKSSEKVIRRSQLDLDSIILSFIKL